MGHVRSRSVALLTAALVLSGCGAATATRSSTSTSNSALSSSSTTSVPLPAGVLAEIPLDQDDAPAPAANGFGSVWVGSHRADVLFRVDEATNKVVSSINLGQLTCEPIVVAAGKVWTGPCDGDSTLTKAVDPATNRVVSSVPGDVIGELAGSLWATSLDSTHLDRIDPATYRTTRTIAVAGGEGAIGGGFLWIADENRDSGVYGGTITKIDPTTGAEVGRLHTLGTDQYMLMAWVNGLLWLKGAGDAFLVRVDTATGRSIKVPIAGFEPLANFADDPVVTGLGSIWVRTQSSIVSRFDPVTGVRTGTYPADPQGNGGYITVDAGSLWVVNFDFGTLWRDRVS